jgi:uncharacterized peroxidase-related enzyme
MTEFPYHTPVSAPEAARPVLEAAQQAYGMLPNLFRKLAESPALAEGYWELGKIFAGCSLSGVEQQVVLLATSAMNGCSYCVGAHSAIADMMKIPAEVTDAIRDGRPINDPRLEALSRFTQALVAQRGWVSDAELRDFLEAGYTRPQVLEVILGVGLKTLSNYANHIMQTELDAAFSERAWEPRTEARTA